MKNYRADILIQIMDNYNVNINKAYDIYNSLSKKELNKLAIEYKNKNYTCIF